MDTVGILGNLVLIFVATASLTVALYVILRLKNKRYDTYFFGVMSFSIALWAGGLYVREIAIEYELTYWMSQLTRIIFASSSLMNSSLVLFSMTFPEEVSTDYKQNNKFLSTYIMIGLVFFIVVLFSNEIIAAYEMIDPSSTTRGGVVYGSYGILIQIYYIVTALVTYINLYSKKIRYKGQKNKVAQVGYALIGFSISAFGVIVPNLLLPLLGITTFNWVGPLFSLVMVGFIGAAVLRLNLWSTKLVLSELLLGGMAIIIIIFLLLSSSLVEIFLNSTTLIMFFLLAYILIREILSSLKRTEQLRRANTKLIAAIEAKDNFIRMTSHQLRTPLTSLIGFLSMIVDKENQEYVLDNGSYKDVVKAYINSQRLASVVNDILTVNAMNAGRFGLNIRQNEDLDFIIQMILTDRKHIAEYYERNISYDKKGERFVADVDPTRFRDVMQNLIDNAISYGKKNILVEIKDKDQSMQIRVQDDGIGFIEDEKHRIGNQSFRGKSATILHPNGSGMGLLIVKRILDDHQGTLEVQSKGRHKGSVISISIPKKHQL